ncbi:protein kinase domain-containing protein [Aspergillus nomiae NRRL 13137]|uniref:non-specific serine/threonine protein kinase n=1 Tax=Aspergillus nomiae NRRL (strain ATCC 15546 / NRRL 13137 / CBS 260.88 / M93) TaxID=1509407 RepID=A0A0L1IKC9_ASPN3|nr:protein kinase domain-containing protein [Aspergillus nomiae NRRL 13137]KNG80046.1 protein kinase domain-containing protein [Aspergillus nomiae NRRL 13137]
MIATRMEPSTVRYKYVEEVERLDYYVPGGYHPVLLGDQFSAGRYVITHKLGFGRSVTTWLAEDRRQNRLVALNISTAESANRMHEVQILSQLEKAKSDLSGKAIVQNLLDSFTFSGPNGDHRCLVTDVARISLHEAKDAAYHRLLHLPAARAIATQLILGLQFIHSESIVHGDLHLGNILLRLPLDMQDMTPEKLYASTGEPAKEQVIREDGAPLDPGVPSEVIVPVWLGLGSDEISLVDSEIMIADFGEAFDPQVTRQFAAHTPLLLAPPESRFAGLGDPDDPLSFSGDIWTLACTVWDIFGDRPPFEAFPATLDEVTIEHVEMLGKLPERWWSKWGERRNWFNEDGCKDVKESLRQWYSSSARDWNQRFTDSTQDPRERNKFDTFSEDERDAFQDMVKSMLVLEPSERATIEEVVSCEWMQRWGLPEVQKMQHAILKTS